MSSDEQNEPNLIDAPSRDEAAEFVRALVRWVGPGFHPDTDFNDYVNRETNAKSYPEEQAARLNAKLDRADAILSQGEQDIYDIAAPVQYALLVQNLRETSSLGDLFERGADELA